MLVVCSVMFFNLEWLLQAFSIWKQEKEKPLILNYGMLVLGRWSLYLQWEVLQCTFLRVIVNKYVASLYLVKYGKLFTLFSHGTYLRLLPQCKRRLMESQVILTFLPNQCACFITSRYRYEGFQTHSNSNGFYFEQYSVMLLHIYCEWLHI